MQTGGPALGRAGLGSAGPHSASSWGGCTVLSPCAPPQEDVGADHGPCARGPGCTPQGWQGAPSCVRPSPRAVGQGHTVAHFHGALGWWGQIRGPNVTCTEAGGAQRRLCWAGGQAGGFLKGEEQSHREEGEVGGLAEGMMAPGPPVLRWGRALPRGCDEGLAGTMGLDGCLGWSLACCISVLKPPAPPVLDPGALPAACPRPPATGGPLPTMRGARRGGGRGPQALAQRSCSRGWGWGCLPGSGLCPQGGRSAGEVCPLCTVRPDLSPSPLPRGAHRPELPSALTWAPQVPPARSWQRHSLGIRPPVAFPGSRPRPPEQKSKSSLQPGGPVSPGRVSSWPSALAPWPLTGPTLCPREPPHPPPRLQEPPTGQAPLPRSQILLRPEQRWHVRGVLHTLPSGHTSAGVSHRWRMSRGPGRSQMPGPAQPPAPNWDGAPKGRTTPENRVLAKPDGVSRTGEPGRPRAAGLTSRGQPPVRAQTLAHCVLPQSLVPLPPGLAADGRGDLSCPGAAWEAPGAPWPGHRRCSRGTGAPGAGVVSPGPLLSATLGAGGSPEQHPQARARGEASLPKPAGAPPPRPSALAEGAPGLPHPCRDCQQRGRLSGLP